MNIHHSLEVMITQEDYYIMGERLFNLLYDLNASKIVIALHPGDDEATTTLISTRLKYIGYEVSIAGDSSLCYSYSAGNDTIAAAINIFRAYFVSKENVMHCRLRDQGEPGKILKGASSCIASCLVPKPAFYAYQFLKNINGKLICWGKYHYVIKNDLHESDSYTIIIMNYNDDIQNLYMRSSSVYETNDIIKSFKDELNIDFSIPVESGQYVIAKYALSNNDSIFAHMSHLMFPTESTLPGHWINMLNTGPQSQVCIENVDNKLNITSAIKGAGIHIVFVTKVNYKEL